MLIRLLPFTAIITACSFLVNAQTPTAVPDSGKPSAASIPSAAKMPMPPTAKKLPITLEKFDDKRVDDYFWLREKSNPEVIDYLKAENTYTQTVLGPMKDFQEQLYKDMLSRIKETDENVPYKKGDYFYYSRTEMGKQYSIYARKKGSLAAPEEIMLDANELAKGKPFFAIGSMDISPDGKWIAYSTDITGFRQYTLSFKNLESGKTLDDKIERVTSIAWANDNKTVFYVTEDATTKRSDKFFRHKLNDKKDELLFEEKDELYGIGVEATRSKGYIILTSASSETSEQRLLDANKPDGQFSLYLKRKDNTKYFIDHHDKNFYIVTNDKGRNSRLVKALAGKADKSNWVEIIPHRKDVKLDGVDMFN